MASLLRALLLIALLAAPLGRLPAAAAAPAGHAAMMAAGHCSEMPAPSPGKTPRMSIDCMIACAAIVPPACAAPTAAAPEAAALEIRTPARIAGIHSAADPPPPRLS